MRQDTDFPIRSDTSISVIIISGLMECVVDMAAHRISQPGMLIILPSQIIERIFFSSDFKGYCLIMSSSFLADFPVGDKVPMLVSVMRQGFYPMGEKHMEAVEPQGTNRYQTSSSGLCVRTATSTGIWNSMPMRCAFRQSISILLSRRSRESMR